MQGFQCPACCEWIKSTVPGGDNCFHHRPVPEKYYKYKTKDKTKDEEESSEESDGKDDTEPMPRSPGQDELGIKPHLDVPINQERKDKKHKLKHESSKTKKGKNERSKKDTNESEKAPKRASKV